MRKNWGITDVKEYCPLLLLKYFILGPFLNFNDNPCGNQYLITRNIIDDFSDYFVDLLNLHGYEISLQKLFEH